MASGGSDLSTRISAEGQYVKNMHISKAVLNHFKKRKVEISEAINRTFPFLEYLRDHGFISKKRYNIYEESSRNHASVQEIVYKVLCELEKNLDLRLLTALFSSVLRRNYPDLNNIYESFKTVVLEESFHRACDSPNIQLSLTQGTGGNSYPSLTYPSPGPSNHNVSFGETTQINAMEASATSANCDALGSHQAGGCRAQESEPAERSRENFLESSMEENPGPGSSDLRNGPGVEGIITPGNSSTLGKPKNRRSRIHVEEDVDFYSEILPVTCGKMKGMLHKNKLSQGGTVKSIRTENGEWLTPREFEVKGGYEKSSNWKLSVRCGGKTLKWLMETGHVSQPPRKCPRKQSENSDTCDVCQDGGKLFCCDTCLSSFHEQCHIPPVETRRNPWSCTFCRVKVPSGSQKCHRESEVLARRMGPEEQSKCELLLLKAYCHFEGSIIMNIPPDNYKKETSQCIKELKLMLNKIKKKLNERNYNNVEEFMSDMYSIFENRKVYDKCNDFVLGITRELKAEINKNFSEVFAVKD